MLNISNAKIGPLFYFTIAYWRNFQCFYNRLQSLFRILMTDKKGGQTYPIFGFW